MALARKHSAVAGASLALTAALVISTGSAYAAAKTAPRATTASRTLATAPPGPGDPRTGPHARDEARHAVQALALAPATTTAPPLKLSAPPTLPSPRGGGNPKAFARVNPALFPSNPKLAREVFGFAPYWALSGNGNWDYSLLSTLAYFGLDVQGDGSFNTSATNNGFRGWMSQDFGNMINRAHTASDRVVLVIKAFDNATINAIVSNPTASQNAINWTIQSIRSRNLDGVNVDFEGSSSSSYPNLPSQFSAFVANLSNQVHAAIPGSVVSVDTYSGSASWDGGFMNIGQLAPSVDSLFVMAYDMGFGNLPGQAAPNAPLSGWTYNDTTSVQQYLSKAPASKVILGVPYYGYKYSTASNLPYAAITGGVVADTYSGIVDDFSCALQLSRNWDTTATSPWASWWSPASGDPCGGNHNSWRELYYDDATSLMAKYDLVNSNNLQGTGMWALGYDGTSPDLWQALAVKLRASWAATFDTSAVPQSWAVNLTRSFTIGVTNVGNSTWPAGGSSPVHLGLHFMAPGSSWVTDQRFVLPVDVPPGQTVNLNVTVTAPAATGAVVLEAQMVKEQQFWFKQFADVGVRLQGAAWLAGYDMRAVPASWTAGQTQSFDLTVVNSGNQTWPATGITAVRLSLHFATAPGRPWTGWLTDQRFSLPLDLLPGQSARLHLSATAPAGSDAIVLEAQMVKEWRFWFDQAASVTVSTAVPSWTAGYDLSGAPAAWTAGATQTFGVIVTNTGNQTWPSTGVNAVRLSLHFATAPGLTYLEWVTDQRFALPADLGPGQSVSLPVTVTAPTGGLPSVLEAQAVKEWQFWFPQAAAVSTSATPAIWLAGYDLTALPQRWVQGQPASVTLTVVNTGNQTWASTGTNQVRLSLHFATAAGLPYTSWLTDQRLSLPADLAPGQRAILSATITPPAGPGAAVLEAEMVKEWQFWFVPRSTIAATNAAPSWMAGYDLSQAPRTWMPGQTQTFTVTLLNAGNQAWPAAGANPVRLGVHFAGSAGAPLTSWLSDQRFSLPADVLPGQTVALGVTVSAPAGDTGGVLEVEAVKEQQFWFPQRAPMSFLAS